MKRDKTSSKKSKNAISQKQPPPDAEIIAERAMEKLRKLIRLSSKRGGNPKMAFEHFDVKLKGTISREQFKKGKIQNRKRAYAYRVYGKHCSLTS